MEKMDKALRERTLSERDEEDAQNQAVCSLVES
jgi:hypothetical protein